MLGGAEFRRLVDREIEKFLRWAPRRYILPYTWDGDSGWLWLLAAARFLERFIKWEEESGGGSG